MDYQPFLTETIAVAAVDNSALSEGTLGRSIFRCPNYLAVVEPSLELFLFLLFNFSLGTEAICKNIADRELTLKSNFISVILTWTSISRSTSASKSASKWRDPCSSSSELTYFSQC